MNTLPPSLHSSSSDCPSCSSPSICSVFHLSLSVSHTVAFNTRMEHYSARKNSVMRQSVPSHFLTVALFGREVEGRGERERRASRSQQYDRKWSDKIQIKVWFGVALIWHSANLSLTSFIIFVSCMSWLILMCCRLKPIVCLCSGSLGPPMWYGAQIVK